MVFEQGLDLIGKYIVIVLAIPLRHQSQAICRTTQKPLPRLAYVPDYAV